tara:strand:+ start:67 stop:198 length:132 start_codon:yes stop_codon:yes gene_type:complete
MYYALGILYFILGFSLVFGLGFYYVSNHMVDFDIHDDDEKWEE